MCKCPFFPLGGDNSLFTSFPSTVPTPCADFRRYIELLELLSAGKCFGNHNAKVLLQCWHAVTLDELAHVNSSSDTRLCSSGRLRGFLAFVYTVPSWDGGGVVGIKRRTMMTCEKWVIAVPTVCVIEQVAAVLPGWWDYQGGALEEREKEGWGVRGVAVHHTVRTCCRHQATSQICVWNPRSIRMGSTIKRNKDR